ncbi:cleavage/polyadenylation specificity factor, 25kDa subunit [Tanacetum coccineum]
MKVPLQLNGEMDGIRVKGLFNPFGLTTGTKSRIEALSDGNLRSCLSRLVGVGETRETRRELSDVLECQKVDIACFQETKWKGSSTKEGNGYTLLFNAGGGSTVPRILWKKLKGDAAEAVRSSVVMGVSTQIEAISVSDADSMWNTLASIIKDAVKDSHGVAIGTSKTHTTRRESWWLCEEVQYKVMVKQKRFRKLLKSQEGTRAAV